MIGYLLGIIVTVVFLAIGVELLGLENMFVSISAFILVTLWRLENRVDSIK